MAQSAEVMLELRDLVVRYDGQVAVDGASLDLPRGKLTALVGPSGCGKTSLLRAVAGFEVPSSGSVRLAGRLVAGDGSWVAPEHRSVGMVFQEGALFPHLDVWRNVRFGLRGLADADDRVRAALELVGLETLGRRYPDELSGGQQQRVALARALAPSPELVLLDEPFASLDADLRLRVREEVREILRDRGVTALMVTHDQQEALSTTDWLAVMHAGKILQTGTPEQIYLAPATTVVAEFIGEGQLVACDVRDGRLTSSLGSAACDAEDGRGMLLVRPEDLLLVAQDRPGIAATLGGRRYFGHDCLSQVRLRSGQVVQARGHADDLGAQGTAIRLQLKARRYMVFRRDDGQPSGVATPLGEHDDS